MAPEELEKLHKMQRALVLFIRQLEAVEKDQGYMDTRRLVAERGRQINSAMEDLCSILEAGEKKE